jgi:hypothetical protein
MLSGLNCGVVSCHSVRVVAGVGIGAHNDSERRRSSPSHRAPPPGAHVAGRHLQRLPLCERRGGRRLRSSAQLTAPRPPSIASTGKPRYAGRRAGEPAGRRAGGPARAARPATALTPVSTRVRVRRSGGGDPVRVTGLRRRGAAAPRSGGRPRDSDGLRVVIRIRGAGWVPAPGRAPWAGEEADDTHVRDAAVSDSDTCHSLYH